MIYNAFASPEKTWPETCSCSTWLKISLLHNYQGFYKINCYWPNIDSMHIAAIERQKQTKHMSAE